MENEKNIDPDEGILPEAFDDFIGEMLTPEYDTRAPVWPWSRGPELPDSIVNAYNTYHDTREYFERLHNIEKQLKQTGEKLFTLVGELDELYSTDSTVSIESALNYARVLRIWMSDADFIFKTGT